MKGYQVFKTHAVIFNFNPVVKIGFGLFFEGPGQPAGEGGQTEEVKKLFEQKHPIADGFEGHADIDLEGVQRKRVSDAVRNQLGQVFQKRYFPDSAGIPNIFPEKEVLRSANQRL